MNQTTNETTLKEFKNLESGDYLKNGIDHLVESLESEGIEADYENIYTDSVGYLARITVSGYQVMVIDALNGDPMVRTVDRNRINCLNE